MSPKQRSMEGPQPARAAARAQPPQAMPAGASVLARDRASALGLAPLTPAAALRLQRTMGNRAVGRLLTAPPSVQRYHVLDPTQAAQAYTTPRLTGTNTMFPRSQQATVTVRNGEIRYTTRSADKGYFGALPSLRVSDGNTMAVEDEAGREQKVFFATEQVVASSRARLKDVGSRSTIQSTGRKIKIPLPDGGGTRELVQVEPKLAADATARFSNLSSECDRAAAEIHSGGGGTSTGIVGADDRRVPTGNEARMAMVTALGAGGGAAQVAAATGVDPTVLGAASAPARAALLLRFPAVDRIAPVVLDWYADAATPAAARSEIELRLAQWAPGVARHWDGAQADFAEGAITALAAEWLRAPPFFPWSVVGRHRELTALQAYAARNQANDAHAAVNAYAAPEVGEAFATFSVSTDFGRGDRVDAGIQGGAIDALRALALDAQSTVQALDAAIQGLKTNAPPSWTYHYASVVARDGGDAVTLENYNRTSEDRSALERRLRVLLANRDDLDAVLLQVNAWMEGSAGAVDPARSAEQRRQYVQARDAAAAALQQLGLRFQSDAQPQGDRWFFQMYGPVKSVPGAADDQSFHRAWTRSAGEFSNPLTLRVSGVADDPYKQRMIAEMRTRVDAVGGWGPAKRRAFKAEIEAAIGRATTRVEVSKAIEAGVERARADASSLLGWALDGLLDSIMPDFPLSF